jgi:hypothetical protein
MESKHQEDSIPPKNSNKEFIIEDSILENSELMVEIQRKNLSKHCTIVSNGKLDVPKSDMIRFQSVPLKKKSETKSSEIIAEEKIEDYLVNDDEECAIDLKNKNLSTILQNLKTIPVKELLDQQEILVKNKLNLLKNISLFETQKNQKSMNPNLLYKLETVDLVEKDQLSITQSKQFKNLIKMCSFQIESRNSILRNTVLKNLVDKYSRKSVLKETQKSSFHSKSRPKYQSDFLLKKIEELTAKNKELQDRNRILEKSHQSLTKKIQVISDYVDKLQ